MGFQTKRSPGPVAKVSGLCLERWRGVGITLQQELDSESAGSHDLTLRAWLCLSAFNCCDKIHEINLEEVG